MPDPRQKKLQKQKKKREVARRAFHAQRPSSAGDLATELRRAAVRDAPGLPAGPCFIGSNWSDENLSRVVPVAITRKIREGWLIAAILLLDMGCLGLTDGLVSPPYQQDKIDELQRSLSDVAPGGVQQVSIEVASTVVRRAVEGARRIGFEPRADLIELLRFLSPESEPDLEVPFGRGGKPLYSPQRGEDTRPVVQKLAKTVGPDGFVVQLPDASEPESESS
jgi:hypothetical protein